MCVCVNYTGGYKFTKLQEIGFAIDKCFKLIGKSGNRQNRRSRNA